MKLIKKNATDGSLENKKKKEAVDNRKMLCIFSIP